MFAIITTVQSKRQHCHSIFNFRAMIVNLHVIFNYLKLFVHDTSQSANQIKVTVLKVG